MLAQSLSLEQILTSVRSHVAQAHNALKDYERSGTVVTKVVAAGAEQQTPSIKLLSRYKGGKMVENIVNGTAKDIPAEKPSSVLNVFDDDGYTWQLLPVEKNGELKVKFTAKNADKSDYKDGIYYLSPTTLQPLRGEVSPGAIKNLIWVRWCLCLVHSGMRW
jgi:hypothetical protein